MDYPYTIQQCIELFINRLDVMLSVTPNVFVSRTYRIDDRLDEFNMSFTASSDFVSNPKNSDEMEDIVQAIIDSGKVMVAGGPYPTCNIHILHETPDILIDRLTSTVCISKNGNVVTEKRLYDDDRTATYKFTL